MLKKITKISSFIIIAFTLLFVSSNSVYAASSGIKSINEKISVMSEGDLQLLNISYNDWTNIDAEAFGLEGKVYNGYDNICTFDTTITYYDSNNNIVVKTHLVRAVSAGETSYYSQAAKVSQIRSGYTINDIAYYELDVVIVPNESLDSEIETIGNGQYAITEYNIDMKVNENNTFDMSEQIKADFRVAKHGIFRSLPLKNTILRLNGTTSSNRAKVTNVEVNNNFTTYKDGENYVIKIGNEDVTLTGTQIYNIKYNYNIGKDPIENYDELYFNLIGTEWDTTISDFTFKITMPKEFDSSKLGFSLGTKGSTDSTDIKYSVDGNVITGSCTRVINSKESLTIRITLPEGYFVGASNNEMGTFTYLIFIVPIIFVLVSFLIWKKYGKDDIVVETVEFYPPEGFNSLEIGYIYKGKAGNEDVVSLLVYLANKGYIKISEKEEKILFFNKKGFKISKIKDYDGNNVNEKIFLNGLFRKKLSLLNVIHLSRKQETLDTAEDLDNGDLTEVTSTDLYDNFYLTMERILNNVNNDENNYKIFEKSASSKTKLVVLMIIVSYCCITMPLIFEYGIGGIAILPFALLFPGIGFTVMFSMLFGGPKTIYINGKANSSSIATKLFGLIWGGLFGGIPWALLVLPSLLENKVCFAGYIIGLLCVALMTIILKILPKRTPYGNQMLGKIRGFKNFLETAEKENLEALVMKEPQYFYNILPYTYVLGVSDKWIKKFETIALQAPNWYDSTTAFSAATFGSFINDTMSAASTSMSSSPSGGSDSSGGGSSGGGSSGGGSGGGGGGSW